MRRNGIPTFAKAGAGTALAAAFGLLILAPGARAESPSEEKARKAAESWLAPVDAGKSGETMTPMLEKSATWRVAGYYIR